MGIKFNFLRGLLVLIAAGMAFPGAASAQVQTSNSPVTTKDAFEKGFFNRDRNFYDNTTTLNREIDFLLGPGTGFATTFPENEIARDAQTVNILYRDVLAQQSTNDPYLRTPDLPNPYNSSLLMSPQYNTDKLKVGTEFRFDTIGTP